MNLSRARLVGTVRLPGDRVGREIVEADERVSLALHDGWLVIRCADEPGAIVLPPHRVFEASAAPNRAERRKRR